jgi:murein DD-endopeptidase MepM/ murein hydrolase activator NlpD
MHIVITLMLGVAAGVAAVITPTAEATAQQTGYAAVWRPGSGVQWWRSEMSVDEFRAQDETYFKQGLRITSLATRSGRFTAVWRPGNGVQWWRSGMTANEFKTQDDTYFKQGLRITSLDIDNGRFTAVWQAGSGAQFWRSGMTGTELEAQDRTYFKQGMRIALLETDNGRFAAVWRPGSGVQWWRSGMTGAEFAAQDQTYFGQGLRVTALAIDGDRLAAVWQTGSGTQWVSRNRCRIDFQTEDAAHFSQGLRLSFIKLQNQAVGAYHYPWRSGDAMRVTQGNNNAAGSHNGSQSFAFDFAFSAGTQVRAAREGTVEWLQESSNATFDPTQPVSPTNTPFKAGSLQNWGNAVRLRHAGGFTSWYFHIRLNGVLVNVGDTVQRGQPIATSGNTGRSTQAHLHFQVQADSTDWGQSVPITFGGNCEVPTGGTTVTSNNGNAKFP